MSQHKRVSHPLYNLLPTEIEGFDSLAELRQLVGANNGYAYCAKVPASRPATDLYRTRDSKPRECGGSAGSGSHPMATIILVRKAWNPELLSLPDSH